MLSPKYWDNQIIAILKKNESGIAVAELCREHGVSQRDNLACEPNTVA